MNSVFFIDERYDLRGDWWNSNPGTKRVPGRLRYSRDDGLRLELSGRISTTSRSANRIHGLLEGGVPVTLFRAFWTRDYSITDAASTNHFANAGAFGAHLPDEVEIRIKSVEILIDGLENWARVGPLRVKYAHEGDLSASPLNPGKKILVYDVGEGVKVRLAPSIPMDQTQLEWANDLAAVLDFETPVPYLKADRIVAHFQNLITVLRGAPSLIRRQRFTDQNGAMFFKLAPQWTRSNQGRYLAQRPLVSLCRIGDFGSSFREWMTLSEKFHTSLHDFFNPIYGANSHLESDLLAFTRSLESFHRGSHPYEREMPEDQFKDVSRSLISAIPKNLDNNLINRIKSQIGQLNQLSLGSRLRRICEELDPSVLASAGIDSEYFVKHVTATRNALTHGGPEKRDYVLEGVALLDLCILSWRLMSLLLMARIGIVGPEEPSESRWGSLFSSMQDQD